MESAQSFYTHHVFFCTNQRTNGESCCAIHQADKALAYCKDLVKTKSLVANVMIRVNKAGCLGRCDFGPTIVIYPEAVWYQYVDFSDIDEIVESHLLNGKMVTRLLIDQPIDNISKESH